MAFQFKRLEIILSVYIFVTLDLLYVINSDLFCTLSNLLHKHCRFLDYILSCTL